MGGSNHSTIYMFDRKTRLVIDTLHHEDNGLAQAVTVSLLCQQMEYPLTYPFRLTVLMVSTSLSVLGQP